MPEETKKKLYDSLKKLTEPFREDQINHLPKPTCRLDEWKKLPKSRCGKCGGYHATEKTIHLAYVGHAPTTARLLDVDPEWSWEPFATDEYGLPVLDRDGGLWIRLTILGITRIGYGDAQGKVGPDAMKERIGDAIRNAAMRFGVALDLWHKGDNPLFNNGHLGDGLPGNGEQPKAASKLEPKPAPKAAKPVNPKADLYKLMKTMKFDDDQVVFLVHSMEDQGLTLENAVVFLTWMKMKNPKYDDIIDNLDDYIDQWNVASGRG